MIERRRGVFAHHVDLAADDRREAVSARGVVVTNRAVHIGVIRQSNRFHAMRFRAFRQIVELHGARQERVL